MSTAIKEALSIEEVVEIINTAAESTVKFSDGSDMRSPEEMAGEYAFDAAEESGYTDAASIEAHLEYLADQGAEFDFKEALQNAIGRRDEK